MDYDPIIIDTAQQVGSRFGYGALMDATRRAWREVQPGMEFTLGPCEMMTMPCPHLEKDENGHCNWCCGSGWVTHRVFKAQLEASTR